MPRPAEILLWPLRWLADLDRQLFPWVPVFLAAGIGFWFSLAREPGPGLYAGAGALLAASILGMVLGPHLLRPLAVAVACLAAGVLAVGARAHLQAAPVLEFRYYGPITGRIVEIDRSASDALRLTLDRVILDRTAPDRTPARVRIALHGAQDWLSPEPGQVVMLTGHLAPPEGPVEPGAFDFARKAWFERLGGVGYTRSPVLLWSPPTPGEQAVNRLRSRLSAAIRAAIPGDSGAFAAGVMTGDRSGLSLAAVEALRDSSLAHLLAISGMNLAFLVGFIFALVRRGLALVPPVALRIDTRKLAAVVALAVAFFYLLLSGSNVATERAFIMVSVMLCAVLLDRRALTLRSVALAATVLLILKPESLLDPGFQMSFAATAALIAGFGAVEGAVMHQRLPRWALPVFTLVLSSVIGGFATAPYAGAHFNRFTDFGLLANLLTVPVMGAVVMPAGAMAALLAPLGLSALPFRVMEAGCDWILWVAARIAAIDGAVTAIPAPGPWVLPLITLGGIWLFVWRGRVRLAGLAGLAAGLVLWGLSDRPALVVSADGALAGLLGPEGRALSAPRGAGFSAEAWLENDGDFTPQDQAAARPGFSGPKGDRRLALNGLTIAVLSGKGAAQALPAACATTDLVILAADVRLDGAQGAPPPGPCRLLDRAVLRRTGAIAFLAEPGGLRLLPARRTGRLWAPGTPLARADLFLPAPTRALALVQ